MSAWASPNWPPSRATRRSPSTPSPSGTTGAASRCSSFLVQCFTGVLLLVYYRPGADAYESVRQITFVMHFGWLIRSAHSWSANLMIFAILVHMFSVFFMKAYRKPREFGWLSGMALLALASVFGFSGYLLPMDELSYFATKVGLQIPAAIPFIGPAIANMLRGGPDVSEFTVQRFFALHVVVLPALFLPLLGFHLWLVQRHGNAVPPSEEAKPAAERKSMPFMPNFLRKDLAMWLISLNILALLASVFPWTLGKQSDSLAPAPVGIHPEWYFMSPFEMLKMLGQLAARRSRRDRRHSAVHPRHRALDSDSVLRHEEGIRPARPRRPLLRPACSHALLATTASVTGHSVSSFSC